MPKSSRGCLRCRQRKVRCDEGRPSCGRCIARGEACAGYREESDLIFRHETEKVVATATGIVWPSDNSRSSSSSHSARSGTVNRPSGKSSLIRSASADSRRSRTPKDGSPEVVQSLSHLQLEPDAEYPQVEREAVSRFFDKYVMYPGKTSRKGFLEFLPCLFEEVNVDGRCALRWAVQAAALADVSRESPQGMALSKTALELYGKALSALSSSLSEKGKTPDDCDLMTVVMLDLFEAFYLPDAPRGAHAQGIAHILRLRGHQQFYSPRGWSLFQLSHHMMQKEQLSFQIPLMPESDQLLKQLGDETDSVRLEKDMLQILDICQRGRDLVKNLKETNMSVTEVVKLVHEMQMLDQTALSWRQGPQWTFKTVRKDDLRGDETIVAQLPPIVHLYPDIWSAYEWNYHRTARINLHEQLLTCLQNASTASIHLEGSEAGITTPLVVESVTTIRSLADKILASVPQTLGDLDDAGRVRDPTSPPPKYRAVGACLLLWSIRTIKAPNISTSEEQKQAAQSVFERLREYTGAKLHLGDLSSL